MQYKYIILLGNEMLGEGIGTVVGKPPSPSMVQNWAYLCPGCGEIWARVIAIDWPSAEWNTQRCPCPQCGIGTIQLHWWVGEEKHAPEQWLRREFLLQMEHGQNYLSPFLTWEAKRRLGNQSDVEFDEPLNFDNIPEF